MILLPLQDEIVCRLIVVMQVDIIIHACSVIDDVKKNGSC